MSLTFERVRAVRFETVLSEGRTCPVVLACRNDRPDTDVIPLVVKAIGCPEISSSRPLVCELMGNALARRLGVLTAKPFIVTIDAEIAESVNDSLREHDYGYQIVPGPAAGCELISPAPVPYTVGQQLGEREEEQAALIYVTDLASLNSDRRREKVNCGLTDDGLLAFDFEMCFPWDLLINIGGERVKPWEPSNGMTVSNHLFYEVAKRKLTVASEIQKLVAQLDLQWWAMLVAALPDEWRNDADRIWVNLRTVAENAEAFGKDVLKGSVTR